MEVVNCFVPLIYQLNNKAMAYKVEVRKMNGQDSRVQYFPDFKKAYAYYASKVGELGYENQAEYSEAEMELTAGGIGCDFEVKILEDKED